ncbi:MAG: type II toxin-antitoxin system MqsA family antitoxin [Enterovibrio sp.]|uniref:type II toxin-antitoxin system MqsA family antitoxin n=1 Tax=Aeromonas veronii TaxID=654 RepID=UPI003D1DB841
MNKMEKNICPFCGEGHLLRTTKDVEYTYKGAKLLIAQPGLYCDECDESILEPKDMAFNRADLQAFRARIDGLLEPKQIQKIRKQIGLTQKQAADIFGGGHNAFSRYEKGETPPPKPLSLLLELLQDKDTREKFYKNHGVA